MGASGLPKIKLCEFSGEPLESPKWTVLLNVVVQNNQSAIIKKCKTWWSVSRVKQKQQVSEWDSAPIILSCLGYTLWEILQNRCQSPRLVQENTYCSSSLARQFYENHQVRKCGYKCCKHFNSIWINIRFGYTEAEAELSSTTWKISPPLREQWLQYKQDRRLSREHLIVFKKRLASKVVIFENLLAHTNLSFDWNKFQSFDKPKTCTFTSNAEESSKPENLECSFKDQQRPIWSCKETKSMKVIERQEHVENFWLYFNCLRTGHLSKHCIIRTSSVPNCVKNTKNFCIVTSQRWKPQQMSQTLKQQ